MRKKETQLGKNFKNSSKKTNESEIVPFTERPAVDRTSQSTTRQNEKLGAADLFSIFTADIIKEEKIFTR